jgi:uncharacterized repeat protein (TIGR03837 family)
VRLWVDDASALAWMAPQGCVGVQVHTWPASCNDYPDCANVVIEAFGCELPEHVQGMIAAQQTPPVVWINLEYLSAEDFVERCHCLPSPVMSGPAKGCTKWFFYPGFTPTTGGLLREPDVLLRQSVFKPNAWLLKLGLPLRADAKRVSLFCYEPAMLSMWLQQLADQPMPTDILVASGRPQAAVQAALHNLGWADTADTRWPNTSIAQGLLALHPLPLLSQTDFDHLLWSCDLNMVRGEDSLVRALWAGKPCVWHIYPQDDNAHHDKLEAFLDWLQAPPRLRNFHKAWNGIRAGLTAPDASELEIWQVTVQEARERLLIQVDLASQLLRFTLDSVITK